MTKTTLEQTDVKTTGISLEESLDDILDEIKHVPSRYEKWYYIQDEHDKFFDLMDSLYHKFKKNINENYTTGWECHGLNTDLFYNPHKIIYSTIYKITKHNITLLERNYLPVCDLCFSPHIHNTIELSEIRVNPRFRGMGIGTQVMKDIIDCVKRTGIKLYVYPGVTTNETRLNGTNPDEQVPKLHKWYGDLGFVKCYPEFTELTNLKTGETKSLGLSGYRVIC